MLYTSNEEFDLERRVHLTNEIPPYDMYEALNSTLQTVIKDGDHVPTIWKWVLGSSKIGYNLPYSVKREDEDGEFEDSSASSSIIGRYDIVRDQPDFLGRTPISEGDVWFKSVNGRMSPVYGPRVKGEGKEKLKNGLNTMYHKMEIDGVWLPEFDLLLHENYRYLENLYPDHPDYRFLLTHNEIDDSFNAAGAVVDYRPANKFFDKVAKSLNSYSRIKGPAMTDDEIEQEAIKIKIRNLRNNTFRRKYYGSKIGYKMLGADIFSSVSVFPVGTYLPIKDVKASDLALENRIRKCISDESKWQSQIDDAERERNKNIKEASQTCDKNIKEKFAQLTEYLTQEIENTQKWYLAENEKLENTQPEDFTEYSTSFKCLFGEISFKSTDNVKRKWEADSNELKEDATGEYDAQFKVREFYDNCLKQFNFEMEATLTSDEFVAYKASETKKCEEIINKENEKFEAFKEEIAKQALEVDSLKEWNRENGLSLSPLEFLKYCRKNNRIIDTYSELYYRKFRLIDWKGDKNELPTEEKTVISKTGIVLPFYNKHVFIDTKDININDIFERDEQSSGISYISRIEDNKVETSQENFVNYKTLFAYYDLQNLEGKVSNIDIRNLNSYPYTKGSLINDEGETVHFDKKAKKGWFESFYSYLSSFTKNKFIKEIKAVEKDGLLYLDPRTCLEQYPDESFSGERKNASDIIYPLTTSSLLEDYVVSQYDVRRDEGLPELHKIEAFRKGQIEFSSDGDTAQANAMYKKVEIKEDQRYALLFENENKKDILVYGSPIIEYADAGLGMTYIKNIKFNITDIPSTKPEDFCELTGATHQNREYFFGENITVTDATGNKTTQERLLVYPSCKVIGMWEASVVLTNETNGTAASYHEIRWEKVKSVIDGKIKNIHLGYIILKPIEDNEDTFVTLNNTIFNIKKIPSHSEFRNSLFGLTSPVSQKEFFYIDFTKNSKSELSENFEDFIKQSNDNVRIISSPKSTIEIECVLDADSESLFRTLKFENETAKKVMKTLSVGDAVFGTGIDTDDNKVFITKIGDDFVEISSPVQNTGTFVLEFEVKKNIFPSSIVDQPEYFRKEMKEFGNFEALNPFKHGLFGSKVWPYTCQAIIDGLADIAMYDDYKTATFPSVMQKCHSLVDKSLDKNGKYIWNLVPSTIKFMNDIFVDLNVNRIIPLSTKNNKHSECLMSVDWLDYFTDSLSDISRATDRVSIGAHLMMQTDTTGLTSNEHGREYTDPSIKLKFITLNWDNMNMWPRVTEKQPEWTVPAYAQIGTAGDGYRHLFRSVDEITHPNVWGATNYDNVISSSEQLKLSSTGGVLRKRGTWGQDQNYVEPDEANKKYYYSVEEPIFEVPLGEYDTQIDYKFDINDAQHALSKVQASFYKERFDEIMKYTPTSIESNDTVSLNSSDSILHNFIESSVSKGQMSLLEPYSSNKYTSHYNWTWCGDWTPTRIEKDGVYVVDWPKVEEVDEYIQYFTIWKGKQLFNINGNETKVFENHSIIFKKPGCDWEYRNFISGGIFGNGILTFTQEDEENGYADECREAYKEWSENPHMKYDGHLMQSLVRWILAVSDMGSYLDLKAVDKLTFEDNTDLLDEYRNLDHLVSASKDVDHAMDTTCYWFMFTGDAAEDGPFSTIANTLIWEKGHTFGIIRDSQGEYHILNFSDTNQFTLSMPLMRTQGQSNQEFDFLVNDSKFGIIPRSEQMNSIIKLPRKFITPGSYTFNFTVDPRFIGEGLKYIIDENGNERPETEEELGNIFEDADEIIPTFRDDWGKLGYRHFNISRSNIYYDSENKCFYTFAEEWLNYEKVVDENNKDVLSKSNKPLYRKYSDEERSRGRFDNKLSKFKIKFNENKFFKNTLEAVVAYTNKISLGESEVENSIQLENIPSLNFPVDKISSNDKVIGIKEVLLRSIWNNTLEASFFSNSSELDGQVLGIGLDNKIIIGAKDYEDKLNFKEFIKSLGKVEYSVNPKTGKYEGKAAPFDEDNETFSSSTSPLLSGTRASYSLVNRDETVQEELEKAEFKYFKNTLILKGTVDLSNPSIIYSENAKFQAGAALLEKGDILIDAKSLSPNSDKVEADINLKNEYGNSFRTTFVPIDFGYENSEFVTIAKDGSIVFCNSCNLDESLDVLCKEVYINDTLKSISYNNGWEIVGTTGVYSLNTSTGRLSQIIELTEDESYKSENGNSIVTGNEVVLNGQVIKSDSGNAIDSSRGSDFIGGFVLVYGEGHITSISLDGKTKTPVELFGKLAVENESGTTSFEDPTVVVTKSFKTDSILVFGGYTRENGKAFIASTKDGVNFELAGFSLEEDDGTKIELSQDTAYSQVSQITFDNNQFVIVIERDSKSYFVTISPDENGVYDFSKAAPSTDISDNLFSNGVISKEENNATYSLKVSTGKLIYASYKTLNVSNGYSVVSVNGNAVQLNAPITQDIGAGHFDVLVSFKTNKDIQNQFMFINKNDNIYSTSGAFVVKSSVQVSSFETADILFSKNEITRDAEDGYPNIENDKEHKFYMYNKFGDTYKVIPLTNQDGNKIKLCDSTGTKLLSSDGVLTTIENRKNTSFAAFKDAGTPFFESLKEANENSSYRVDFSEFNNLLKNKKLYISNLHYNKGQVLINVDDLSKGLSRLTTLNPDRKRRENLLLWTNEQDFIKFMGNEYSSSRYVMKEFYEVDKNLEEDIYAILVEDKDTDDKVSVHHFQTYDSYTYGNDSYCEYDPYYGGYGDAYNYGYGYEYGAYYDNYEWNYPDDSVENKYMAIFDTENNWFVLKKNIYLTSTLNIPYSFVGGGKAFSTGNFFNVPEKNGFESPVTGIYLPEKGYGGHRSNFRIKKDNSEIILEKPWDIDPAAFEDEYIKNENGEFVFLTDRFGTSIDSYSCEIPVYSNGETLKITKDSFYDSGEKVIEVNNGIEAYQLKLTYLSKSKPECFVASDHLILGNTWFDTSMLFFRDGEIIRPDIDETTGNYKVYFTLHDRDGRSHIIPMTYQELNVDGFSKKELDSVIRYKGSETVNDSSNPDYITIKYVINGETYEKEVSVEMFSKNIKSQPTILVKDLPEKYFYKVGDSYKSISFDESKTESASVFVSDTVSANESWKNSYLPTTYLESLQQQAEYIGFKFTLNNSVDSIDVYQQTHFDDSLNRKVYMNIPFRKLGTINAFYSEIDKNVEDVKNATFATRLVLLSLISRINAVVHNSVNLNDNMIKVNKWVNALLGNGSLSVDIFGDTYSTDSSDSKFRIISIYNLIQYLRKFLNSDSNIILERLFRIMKLLEEGVVIVSDNKPVFNQKFSSTGEFAQLAQEFYDGVNNLEDTIKQFRDIKAVYLNNKKQTDYYFGEKFIDTETNSEMIELFIKGKHLIDVPVSKLSPTLTCGIKFLDNEPDVFVTDSNEVNLHIYNVAVDSPLILKGVKGKVICKKPKYASLKDLVNTISGLGYIIENPDSFEIKVNDYHSEIAAFQTISESDSTATLNVKRDLAQLNDGKMHFVKLSVLTQKDIETSEVMFENSNSFIEIDPSDIVDFPPNRVYYSRQEDGTSNGYPLPPVIFTNSDGDIASIIRSENSYAYYKKLYTNGNKAPVYECDEHGNFISYTGRDDKTRIVNKEDTIADLHQPRRPLYQTCKEWFEKDFFSKGNEVNPFWQVVEISSYFDTAQKDWVQTGKVFEYSKSSKGIKLSEIDKGNSYFNLSKSAIYKFTTDRVEVELDSDFVNLKDGEIKFTLSLNSDWGNEENGEKKKRLVKYGINAFNSFSSRHSFNTENAKTVDNGEKTQLFGYLTSKYTVNSKENLVSTNDKDSSIVPITEIGLFNKQHQMIAYAHFPAIEYRSDTQHLDFTMFIYNGVMKS